MFFFFTILSLVEFQVSYLASVIDGFAKLWMGICTKSIQLMMEFLKAAAFVIHFPYYTLMTFLMVVCNIAIYADETTLNLLYV